ncbi:hypothetical protein M0811_01491 [Anaeramoeba ignava]|uniref:Transmembrane protein n=1 Tax=Anaeramoeba ignava TaxID=1746090 RepID=A0A9Q0RA03_ANAIG|nr:hypothetical protein M0811_01491 [Anaeramoeba ignava]
MSQLQNNSDENFNNEDEALPSENNLFGDEDEWIYEQKKKPISSGACCLFMYNTQQKRFWILIEALSLLLTLILLIWTIASSSSRSGGFIFFFLLLNVIIVSDNTVTICHENMEYWKSLQNIFDFIVMIFCILSMFVYFATLSSGEKTMIIICFLLRIIRDSLFIYLKFKSNPKNDPLLKRSQFNQEMIGDFDDNPFGIIDSDEENQDQEQNSNHKGDTTSTTEESNEEK